VISLYGVSGLSVDRGEEPNSWYLPTPVPCLRRHLVTSLGLSSGDRSGLVEALAAEDC
jgi:hypothetical protein